MRDDPGQRECYGRDEGSSPHRTDADAKSSLRFAKQLALSTRTAYNTGFPAHPTLVCDHRQARHDHPVPGQTPGNVEAARVLSRVAITTRRQALTAFPDSGCARAAERRINCWRLNCRRR
jgi:hypothetical protein